MTIKLFQASQEAFYPLIFIKNDLTTLSDYWKLKLNVQTENSQN